MIQFVFPPEIEEQLKEKSFKHLDGRTGNPLSVPDADAIYTDDVREILKQALLRNSVEVAASTSALYEKDIQKLEDKLKNRKARAVKEEKFLDRTQEEWIELAGKELKSLEGFPEYESARRIVGCYAAAMVAQQKRYEKTSSNS